MKRILLIDDNIYDNIDCIKILKTKYKVDVVSHIESARSKLMEFVDYDLIVLDIMMPSLESFDLEETLDGLRTGLVYYEKELIQLNIPVLFWSLAFDFEERIKNKKWTKTFFLPKCTEEDHLLVAVDNLLKRS